MHLLHSSFPPQAANRPHPNNNPDSRRLSENSICALKPGEIGEVYGRKTLAIPPILSIQMLFLDSLLALQGYRQVDG